MPGIWGFSAFAGVILGAGHILQMLGDFKFKRRFIVVCAQVIAGAWSIYVRGLEHCWGICIGGQYMHCMHVWGAPQYMRWGRFNCRFLNVGGNWI